MAQSIELRALLVFAAAAFVSAGSGVASAQYEQTVTQRTVRATLDGEPTAEPTIRVSPEGPLAPVATPRAPRLYRATLDGGAAAPREARVVRTELDGNVVAPLNVHRASGATARLYRTEL